ncbi:MAG: cell division protein YceG involved in septum cleavage [bacterium]|jgi:cell division protein YceG involved in septum cleavage
MKKITFLLLIFITASFFEITTFAQNSAVSAKNHKIITIKGKRHLASQIPEVESKESIKNLNVLIVYIEPRKKDANRVAKLLKTHGVIVTLSQTSNSAINSFIGKVFYSDQLEDQLEKLKVVIRLIKDIEVVEAKKEMGETYKVFRLWIAR